MATATAKNNPNLPKKYGPFAWLQRRGFFLGWVFSLVAAVATFLRLRAYNDPPGLNGYFYLKQTKTLAESGTFYFGDHSLSFLPLVLLRWLTGSELLAFQTGIPLMLLAAGAGLCFLVERIPAHAAEKAITQLAILLALYSSSFFAEFALNFFKNLTAATLLVWCAGFLLGGRRRSAFVFFVLAFLTHKSVALVGGLFLAAWAAGQLWRLRRQRDWRVIGALAAAAAAALVFGLIFLFHFPKAQAFLEFARSTFSDPANRSRWWMHVFRVLPQRGAEAIAWAAFLAGALAGWRFLPTPARLIAATGLLLFLFAVHPFQTVGPATLGYRQLLLLPILLYPLGAFVLYFPARYRLAALLPLLAVFYFNFAPLGFKPNSVAKQIRPFSDLQAGVEKIPEVVRPEHHLTSHHGLEFYIDYKTNIRSRSFLAAEDFTGPKFRVVYMPRRLLRGGPARDEIDQANLLSLGKGYFLLSEEDWEEIDSQFDLPFSWKNLLGRRPAHVYE